MHPASRSVFSSVTVVLIMLLALAAGAAGESLSPAWSSVATYPNTTMLQSCAIDQVFGNLFCVGGLYAAVQYASTVDYTPLPLTSSSPWTSTISYPSAIAGESCVVFEYYIYCTGGYNGAAMTADVYYTQLLGNGTSSWTRAPDYPISAELQSCVVVPSYIDCVGGYDGANYYTSTYYVRPSPGSSSQNTWTNSTVYPIPVSSQSCVFYSGYIYCVGGLNSNGPVNSVYSSPVLSTGGLGPWLNTTAYPATVYNQSCAVYQGYIYCVGGYSKTGYSSAVYYSQILSPGVLGPWTQTTSYPNGVVDESCLAYSGSLYCVGGFDGSVEENTVYSDAIQPLTPITVTSTSTLLSTTTATFTTTSVSKTTLTSTTTETSALTKTVLTVLNTTSFKTSTVTTTTNVTASQVTTKTTTSVITQNVTIPVSTGIATSVLVGATAGSAVAAALVAYVVARTLSTKKQGGQPRPGQAS